MRRDVKVEGGLIAHAAWWLRVGLIDLSVVVCKAVVWLYRFLTDLPLWRICCLTTSLTCYIFILHCFNPYINVFLFLLLAQSVIGFVAPDNPRRQRRGRSRGRRCNRRV